jgi:hypothetical protein
VRSGGDVSGMRREWEEMRNKRRRKWMLRSTIVYEIQTSTPGFKIGVTPQSNEDAKMPILSECCTNNNSKAPFQAPKSQLFC